MVFPGHKETRPMANPFCYAELHAQNPSTALDFYRRLFDWQVKSSETPVGAYHELEPGEGFPGGLMAAQGGAASRWVVYMKVDDLAAHTKKAAALGAQVQIERAEVPEVGSFSLLVDP